MADSMDVDMFPPTADDNDTDSPKATKNATSVTTINFDKPKIDHLEAFGADIDDDHHSTNSSSKDIDVFKSAIVPPLASSNIKNMADPVVSHEVDADAKIILNGAKADAELDKEEAVSMLVDTPFPKPSSTSTTSAAVPKHVALRESELSPVSGSSSPEIPVNPLMSRVSFPGERAFSADNTDSDGSGDSQEDNVDTLDSEAFSSLDVSTKNTVDSFSFSEQEDGGQVTANLTRALQTQAVELCVEARGLAATMMRAPRGLFVVLYMRGSSPGTWSELERTETVVDPRGNNRWVHKMRLPAATTLDRSEYISLAVFEEKAKSGASSGLALKKQIEEGPGNAIAACSLRVAQLLCSPAMALDIELTSPRSNRVKGLMSIAADLVPHLEHDELLTFDVAFEKDAPARNRVLFVVSRSVPKGRWSPIYRSEVRTRAELDMFRSAVLKNREVNSGNEKRLLRIEFYRYYKNRTCTLLGFCQTSLLSLRTCPLNAGIYWWPAQDGIPDAKVVLTRRTVTEESSSFSLRVVPASRKIAE